MTPDVRVARSLASLFHPVLYPGVGDLLRITQQELGYLVGLSRQRVNEALRNLQAERLIRIGYGGVKVLDLDGLRRHGAADPASRVQPRAVTAIGDTTPPWAPSGGRDRSSEPVPPWVGEAIE